MKITNITNNLRPIYDNYVKDEWAGPMVATRGKLYDTRILPTIVATSDNGKPWGFLSYNIQGDSLEIVTLFCIVKSVGAGTALMDRAAEIAKENSCNKMWLITTNDNTNAIKFFQKYGMTMSALHANAFENITRKLKQFPQNETGEPILGNDNIRILHEIEFEILI